MELYTTEIQARNRWRKLVNYRSSGRIQYGLLSGYRRNVHSQANTMEPWKGPVFRFCWSWQWIAKFKVWPIGIRDIGISPGWNKNPLKMPNWTLFSRQNLSKQPSKIGVKSFGLGCKGRSDGTAVKLKKNWVEKLGCKLSNTCDKIKTSFKHPKIGEDVYIILEPRHMLKLARNALGHLGSFVDGDEIK